MEVESAHIADIDWDDGTLYIQFRKDGARYSYSDVPFGVYQELMAAPSKSQYFRENVKGTYEYARVA